jgi:pimeloyl-[acyl-carrier protein] methyl ester esterase
VLGADWPHAVAHDVFAQFAAGLRQDWRRTLERFLALEAHGSERAQSELRALKSQLFERGDPSLEVLQQGLQALDRTDLRADLARLTRPSTWIAGRRDRLVPAAAMRWSAAIAADADYVELSAGHAPFLGHPDTVAEAIGALAARTG